MNSNDAAGRITKVHAPASVIAGLGLLALVAGASLAACGHAAAAERPAAATDGISPPVFQTPPAASATQLDCQGDDFRIDVLDAIGQIPDDTLEVQREQLRDWVWSVTLGRVARKTSASVADIFSGVADEPLVRDDALAHVLRLPVGPTRVASTKSGDAIVLVESAAASTMGDEIVEAIDDEALSLGHTPGHVSVYGYQIEPSIAQVHVCQLRPLDRAALESADKGYRSATLTSAADLQGFLAGGVDLLEAACTDSGLRVSGRQRPRAAQDPVTPEQVSALAKPLGRSYVPLSEFGKTFADLPKNLQVEVAADAKSLDELFREASHALVPQLALKVGLKSAGLKKDEADFVRAIYQWKRKNPGVPTAELLASYTLQRALDGKPGFSLDPVYHASDVSQALGELLAALPDPQKTEQLLRAWGATALLNMMSQAKANDEETLRAAALEVRQARARISRASDERVESILWGPSSAKDVGAAFGNLMLQAVDAHSGRQCARYDGPLAGTAAGMTFFYTDLAAKFFLMDWKGKSPEGTTEGFESLVNHPGSTAWCSEADRPGTRIWFGLRDEGYTKEDGGAKLRFAPTATRLFAMGSNPGSGDAETEPDAASERFIRWWDAHYASIASWDPQYESLNQLMKWSAVVQATQATHKKACDVLASPAVTRDLRLDTWAASKPALKWREAVAEMSSAQASAGPQQCLPLLLSKTYAECGQFRQIWGGVSVAAREQIAAKPPRLTTPGGLGRIGVAATDLATDASGIHVHEIHRSAGILRDVTVSTETTKVTFRASVDTNASQTGSQWSYATDGPVRSVVRTVHSDGGSIRISAQENGLAATGLLATDLDQAVVHMQVTPGDEIRARRVSQAIASRMNHDGSSLEDAGHALAAGHDLLSTDDGCVALQLPGASGTHKAYAVMASGGGNRGPPGSKVEFTIGSPEGGRNEGTYAGADHAVQVWVVYEPDASTYFASHHAKASSAVDGTRDAVNAKLATRDVAGALEALGKAPSVPGAVALLEAAVDSKDTSTLTAVIQTVGQMRPPPDMAPLYAALERQRALIARSGGDTRWLAPFLMKIAMKEAAAVLPSADDAAAVQALASRTVAPARFSRQAALPLPIYPTGAVLPPGGDYVSRVVPMPEPSEGLAKFATADNEEYEVRTSRQTQGRPPLSGVGSAMRLLGHTTRGVAVVPCSDADPDRPRCHEPLPALDEFRSVLVSIMEKLQVCDANGDRSFTTPDEKACLRSVDECDRDGDGVWARDDEKACLKTLRDKYHPESAPPKAP